MDQQDLVEKLRELDLKALDDYKTGKADPPVLYKAGGFIGKAESNSSGPIDFVASEESPDRMGDTISAEGWDLKPFKKNPVFLWSHNAFEPPIGRVAKVAVEGKQLLASVVFDSEDPLAASIEGKFRRGFLKAVSVGFRALEFEREGDGIVFKKHELLELSAVAIPAHPKALMRSFMQAQRFYIQPGFAPPIEVVPPPADPPPAEPVKSIDYAAIQEHMNALRQDLNGGQKDA